MLPSDWQWTTDVSVKNLDEAEAKELLDDDAAIASEITGVGFELISPPPPNVLAGQSGLYSVAETVGLLASLGVQAGPSQGMHVHINVGKPGKPTAEAQTTKMGRDLTPREIGNVWVQYAKYQFVIDEMLQGSRVDNHYARGLHFGFFRAPRIELEPGPTPDLGSESEEASRMAGRTFEALWQWVNADAGSELDATAFCDSVLMGAVDEDSDGSNSPCSQRYPSQRYTQLNLAPLNRLGTIEFRGFPATTDSGRIILWTKFLLKFVAHFHSAAHPFFEPENLTDPVPPLRASTAAPEIAALQSVKDARAASLRKLVEAQSTASRGDLERELGFDLSGLFSNQRTQTGAEPLPATGRWEEGNRACLPVKWPSVDAEKARDAEVKADIEEQKKGNLPIVEVQMES